MKRFIAAFLLCLGLSLHAQTPNSPSTPAPRTFRIFSVVSSFPGLKFDVSPKRTILLNINRELSDSYPCPLAATLTLYRELPIPPDSPPGTKPVKEVVGEIPLPANQPHVIIIVAPADAKKLVAKVIEDTPEKHPGGTIRVVNLSTFNAALMLNDDSHALEIGASKILPYGSGSTLIQMAVQKNGGWAPAFSKERIARPGIRAYGFIFNYASDPDVDGGGPPAPALFRFFTEPVIDVKTLAKR